MIMNNPNENMRANDPPSKEMDVYTKERLAKNHFFTNLCPDILEKQLLTYLTGRSEMEPTQNKEKYELKFSLGKQIKAKPAGNTLAQTDGDLENELEEAMEASGLVQMTMRITKSPDAEATENLYAVELLSKDVDQFRFNKAAVDLIKNGLYFAIE